MRALLFHNVVGGPVDPFDRACERLPARQLAEYIADLRERYDIVPFEPALWSAPARGPKPRLLLTFDDGFAGVFDEALPILRDAGCAAIVFVLTEAAAPIAPDCLLHFERLEIALRLTQSAAIATEHPAQGAVPLRSIADRVGALKALKRWLKHLPSAERIVELDRVIARLGVDEPSIAEFAKSSPGRYRKLSRAQIDTLVSHGWTIGGHTRSHPSLAHEDDASLHVEIDGNASALRALGVERAPFAYPYGGPDHVSPAAEAVIRDAGFCCAFTTMPGDNDALTNPFRLYRFSVPDLQRHELGRLGAEVSRV